MVTFSIKFLGRVPDLNARVLLSHESQIFKVVKFEQCELHANSDLGGWGFSDDLLRDECPPDEDVNVTVGIINHPLQLNWYLRRVSSKVAVMSVAMPSVFLFADEIGIENFVLKNLYEIALVFQLYGHKIPTIDTLEIVHDATRGCIFDMNGDLSHVVYSCVKPIICDECRVYLSKNHISVTSIAGAEKELKALNRRPYYRMKRFIQRRPYLALILSAIAAIILGVFSNVIYGLISTKG